MTFEQPQAGNPHQLTIKQHVVPVASIERFASDDGCVEAWLNKQNKAVRISAHNPLLYAQRVWNQSTERGAFKRIEDAFQRIADALVTEALSVVTPEYEIAITRFYALCYYRGQLKASPTPDVRQSALDTGEPYDQNQAEVLEKNGYVTVRPDGTLPGRHLAGLLSYFRIGQICRHLSNHRWQVVRSTRAHFVVPDQFPHQAVMPVSPQICLAAGADGWAHADESDVRRLNRLFVAASRQCYFARELAQCPR